MTMQLLYFKQFSIFVALALYCAYQIMFLVYLASALAASVIFQLVDIQSQSVAF